MGRIRTQMTKRLGTQIIREYQEQIHPSFEDNKKIVGTLIPSKKVRNKVAGYLTSLVKAQGGK